MKQLLRVLSIISISSVMLSGAMLVGLTARPASGEPHDFPRPSELERDVEFWKRIYSEVGTDAGLLHDTRDLSVVYEITKIPTGLSPHAREKHTEKRKKHFKNILLRLAAGKRTGLSREETHVLGLFDHDVSNTTLRQAADNLRFQLGQANKFRAGVIRSGAYKPHILQNLRDMNLPLEIANLPHVESSYTPNVYSRVGAAGLWQFTRSTGRRFMQVDHIVDERLDPYHASIAAARLLEQNYRVTGTWPLAITAYNHGASGMRRAAMQLGTKDIAQIVRNYRSRTFGFASRNFYVEFLAANVVASNPDFYFGPLELDRPIAFESIELPYYAKASQLVRTLGIDRATLEEANPALRPAVWNESKHVPKGFTLRVPRAALPRPLDQAIASLPKEHRYASQTRDTTYVVSRGDTLSTIARRHSVSMNELVALNGLRSRNSIRIGQKLKLPPDAGSPRTRTAAYTPTKTTAPRSQPETKPRSAAKPAARPDTDFYTVRRGDNLTRIADRFGMSVAELVRLNELRSQHRIAAGQRLRVRAGKTREPVVIASLDPSAAASSAKARDASHPDASAELSPARSAALDPDPNEFAALAAHHGAKGAAEVEPKETEQLLDDSAIASGDESPIEPSPGLLADPTDYTVASNGTITVQTNETLGHYAEWLGLRASRLRQINGLRFEEPVVVQRRLRLDFANVSPEEFERIRVEYHRELQEEFFAEWEIEGTVVHRVGPGDSLWTLSTRRFDVPLWLLRQYNPDVNLEALTAGTELTIPRLRQRSAETSASQTVARNSTPS